MLDSATAQKLERLIVKLRSYGVRGKQRQGWGAGEALQAGGARPEQVESGGYAPSLRLSLSACNSSAKLAGRWRLGER